MIHTNTDAYRKPACDTAEIRSVKIALYFHTNKKKKRSVGWRQ